MKAKTRDLTGTALDWAVSEAIGEDYFYPDTGPARPKYSSDWAVGGEIVEQGLLVLSPSPLYGWRCNSYMNEEEFYGPTPLIAAMRCYVASQLGDEIEIPEELI